jgi:catechol 2,3-dioxygenase-like lactoylglutathione lyase family enzyme
MADQLYRRHASLNLLSIGTLNIETAVTVYSAVCGAEPGRYTSPDGSTKLVRFFLGNAIVELMEPLGKPAKGMGAAVTRQLEEAGPGVHLVCLPSDDPAATAKILTSIGARVFEQDEHRYVHPHSANGVLIQLTPRQEFGLPPDSGDAHFDHVAIAVKDLDQACGRWAVILGTRPDMKGPHPLGTFNAARFLLGDRMIELVAPRPGVDSAVSQRLGSTGEGVIAVALVSPNFEKTLERVKAAGARVMWREPHWFVHPKDAAGVLIQLTPRVEH